jgi:hypothetical protein
MKKLLIILMLLSTWAWADSFNHDNDTDIEDTHGASANADVNYGSSPSISILESASADRRYFIRFANLNDSIGVGKVIDSAFIYIVLGQDVGGTGSYRVYGMWNNEWNESEATWNSWHDANDSQWTTAGIACAYDAGDFTNWDDAGCDADSADRQSTYLCEVEAHTDSVADDTMKHDVKAWVDTCYQNSEDPSFLFQMVTENQAIYFYTREAVTANREPFMVVWYSDVGATTKIWKILK